MNISKREVFGFVAGMALGVYFAPGIRRIVMGAMNSAEQATQ